MARPIFIYRWVEWKLKKENVMKEMRMKKKCMKFVIVLIKILSRQFTQSLVTRKIGTFCEIILQTWTKEKVTRSLR